MIGMVDYGGDDSYCTSSAYKALGLFPTRAWFAKQSCGDLLFMYKEFGEVTKIHRP